MAGWLAISCSSTEDTAPQQSAPFTIKGVDASLVPQVRASGITTKNTSGQPEDMLQTLKNEGVNTIRLRLWKDPDNSVSGFAEVQSFAQEIKAMGMKVWLTVHYSDTWADPGNQQKPQAWAGLTGTALSEAVYQYTKDVVQQIRPDYIQVGNEINSGFLWPDGSWENTQQFHLLLAEGIRAVRETSPETKIMLHYAGYEGATSFVSGLSGLDYDIIALSYYPVWHGSFDGLQQAIAGLGATFGKPVVIAETSYPFTLGWNDFTSNIIGSNGQILAQYPATLQGQAAYLQKIRQVATQGFGGGFCYWGGEWISFNGNEATDGSPYENQALWDFNNTAVPAIKVFN